MFNNQISELAKQKEKEFMSDSMTRFISGEITNCYLSKPKTFHGKNGDWESYTLHINGAFEDTRDLVDSYFKSRYPVRVFEGGDDPIDPKETDGLKFKGRIMVKQVDDRFYLNAVSIEQRIGADEPPEQAGNPFKENPLVS